MGAGTEDGGAWHVRTSQNAGYYHAIWMRAMIPGLFDRGPQAGYPSLPECVTRSDSHEGALALAHVARASGGVVQTSA